MTVAWMVAKGLDRTYSSGNCSGFTPDSLFTPLEAETKTGANIYIIIKGKFHKSDIFGENFPQNVDSAEKVTSFLYFF